MDALALLEAVKQIHDATDGTGRIEFTYDPLTENLRFSIRFFRNDQPHGYNHHTSAAVIAAHPDILDRILTYGLRTLTHPILDP